MQDFDITEIHQGDKESFKPFFERYTMILRHFAMRYLPDDDFVKDVVQETMVRFWERRRNFNSISAVISFLFTATRNAVFDEMRHRKVVSSYALAFDYNDGKDFNLPEFHDPQMVLNVYNRLEEEVSRLPHRTQEIIRLKLAGFQLKEIAEVLNIGRETVKTLQRLGMDKLGRSMKPLQELYFSHQDDFAL